MKSSKWSCRGALLQGSKGIARIYTFEDAGNVEIGPEGIYIKEWSDGDEDFGSLGAASELI